jgi:hypothetical protein
MLDVVPLAIKMLIIVIKKNLASVTVLKTNQTVFLQQ